MLILKSQSVDDWFLRVSIITLRGDRHEDKVYNSTETYEGS